MTNRGKDIQTNIKSVTDTLGSNHLPEIRKTVGKECEQAHGFIFDIIKKLSALDKIIFYDKFTDEITPELLYKYQMTDKCYETIQPNTICYQCLDCSTDEHAFILCAECSEEHKRAHHLLLPRTSKEVSFCHCGDEFLDKGDKKACQIHTCNKIVINEKDENGESRSIEELEAIKKNVTEIFERVEAIGKLVIPQIITEMCENILIFLNTPDSADLSVFMLHIARWLNRVVRINPLRSIIKESLKMKIKTKGKFLLTNCIEEIPFGNGKISVRMKTDEELEKSEVTAHEIFLNLCLMEEGTSSYFSRFLYLILDKQNESIFIKEYRKAYATIYFHGTSLPHELGAFLDKIDVKTIIPHILNLLIIILEENKPITDANAMLHFTSLILLSEDNIMEILKREYNLQSFITLCDRLTMYPFATDNVNKQVLKMFHPIFISVLTRLQVTKELGQHGVDDIVKLHQQVLGEIGHLIIQKEEIAKQNDGLSYSMIVNSFAKIVFGRDGMKTEMDRSVLPSHFYLFTLIGYIAHLKTQSRTQTKEHCDIFKMLKLTTQDKDYEIMFLHFVFTAYAAIQDKIYFANIFDMKEFKAPQMEVEDYLGELTHPIIYSSIMFIAHACLVSLGYETFMNELERFACTQQTLTPLNVEHLDCVILDFVTSLFTFSRLGTDEKSVGKFFDYYKYNIQCCDGASGINSAVVEFLNSATSSEYSPDERISSSGRRQTITSSGRKSSDGNFSNSPQIVIQTGMSQALDSMTASGAAKKSGRVKKLDRKSSSLSIDVTQAPGMGKPMKKGKTKKSPRQHASSEDEDIPVFHAKACLSALSDDIITTLYKLEADKNVFVMQFRKKVDRDARERDEKPKDFNDILLKLRIEQRGLNSQMNQENPLVWGTLIVDPGMCEERPDYFFPFVNASCKTRFRQYLITNYLLEPISQGDRKVFLTFMAPHMGIGKFASIINEQLCKFMEAPLLTDPSQITETNHLFALRYFWIILTYKTVTGGKADDLFKSIPLLSKMMSTCYGFLFADICLLIPETSLELLMKEIFAMLSKEPFSPTDIDAFKEAVLKHRIGRYFFGGNIAMRSMDINPFNDSLINFFNKQGSKLDASVKKTKK